MSKDKLGKMLTKVAQKAIDIKDIKFLGHEVKVLQTKDMDEIAKALIDNHLGAKSVYCFVSISRNGGYLLGSNMGPDLDGRLDLELMHDYLVNKFKDTVSNNKMQPSHEIYKIYFKLAENYVRSHLDVDKISSDKQNLHKITKNIHHIEEI